MILIQNKNYNHNKLETDDYIGTVFKKVYIKFTTLIDTKFEDCNFIEVDFGRTDVLNCSFVNCNFSNCELFHTNFKNCHFENVKGSNFDLRAVCLLKIILIIVIFSIHVLEDLKLVIIYLEF